LTSRQQPGWICLDVIYDTTDMESTPWLFDELAHAGDEHLDPAYVTTYDGKAKTDPSEDLALLQRLGLDHAATLLDFGTGTGTFALAAASVCGRVVAIDVSVPMLERLKQRTIELEISNVELVQAGFLTYTHQGKPADFAYSRNALHHLPDFWKAIALWRVGETLRPGGTFFLRDLVYSFDPRDAQSVIDVWLHRAPVRLEEGFTASDLATHVRHEYSTYTWLLEPMLTRAGFEIRDVEYSSPTFAAYTCVKR
jgi:ubiquinone/menaquinone biosynthesis C-methylase UbiE